MWFFSRHEIGNKIVPKDFYRLCFRRNEGNKINVFSLIHCKKFTNIYHNGDRGKKSLYKSRFQQVLISSLVSWILGQTLKIFFLRFSRRKDHIAGGTSFENYYFEHCQITHSYFHNKKMLPFFDIIYFNVRSTCPLSRYTK